MADSRARIKRLLRDAEREFRARFLALVSRLRGQISLDDLASLIERGRASEALANLERVAEDLGTAWSEHFTAAATALLLFLRTTSRVEGSFDVANLRAVRILQESRLRLVGEFSRQQWRAIQEALLEGLRQGQAPLQVARAVRDSIGLTEYQQRIIQSYRRGLENLESDVLRRTLRDPTFDQAIRSAINNRKPPSQRQISRMVAAYRERLINQRAEAIAVSEARRAVHEGAEEAVRQAIEAGDLGSDQVKQVWETAQDERVRGSHRPMHRQERPFGQPFLSGNGNLLRFPGDPRAPLSDTINCRCEVFTEILDEAELQESRTGTITRVGV